ncbi:pirin domain-containing protein domain-containing protein [Schizosaccharomyces cryophilus OY26]|uniref:Pirin domain-containing protein domain-containing protein n=1 Tax=Schizosaccharomyces cryophilus (strain OY26 / ATCC MYA-4695 / CBS 11777 / NBRC 106824 / NRRL Y48691) TaxID=653667 RepID=S9VU01_SCHCR|nr:pirin domain-containing protein domain-containing protein [Schizosaccharomyces cryophilus OY26]EPY49575.1 pirin domain-containing protein domain-containing protein [Schizosaccharomyces cryophilus OY26]
MQLIVRKSGERGFAQYKNFLKTFHTFSFANYFDLKYMGFGPLRVINEDRVDPMSGFPTHHHQGYEIWTMGNTETIQRGDIQYTSAGTGIAHSEYNNEPHGSDDSHFLQIWAKPDDKFLPPTYYTRHHSEEDKHNRLQVIIAPNFTIKEPEQVKSNGAQVGTEVTTDGSVIPFPGDLGMWASILSPGSRVTHVFGQWNASSPLRKGYLHLIQTSGFAGPRDPSVGKAQLKVGDKIIQEGDGLFIVDIEKLASLTIESIGSVDAEFVFFDMTADD